MRRKEREIIELDCMIAVIKKCKVCSLALFDKEFPYLVPMNFGMAVEDGTVFLYFHGAGAGKKMELLKANNKVGFAMSCEHKLIDNELACRVAMEYESICGNGILEIVPEEEKNSALCHFMQQYSKRDSYEFHEAAMRNVTLLKLTVNELHGKAHKE